MRNPTVTTHGIDSIAIETSTFEVDGKQKRAVHILLSGEGGWMDVVCHIKDGVEVLQDQLIAKTEKAA
jgi:hypothetical protein